MTEDRAARAEEGWGLREGDALTEQLTVLRKLGGGSAYEAYLAFDDVTYAHVVAKVVRPAQVADEATLRGLRREVEMLERVRHPAVVRALRAQVEGPRPHVVLEQLDGPRLSSLIRRYGRLEAQQYLPLGIELASALHYLRGVGIAHLDVKPSNVIMGAPARLIDLSVARGIDRAQALTSSIGTDDYMAPEQCDPPHTGTPGYASDVWGLGATLFHAVAGYRAFDRGDGDARHRELRHPQLVDEPYQLPDDVDPDVTKVVYACLELRPEDRPTPAEVADALGPVLDRTPRGRLAGFKIGSSARPR